MKTLNLVDEKQSTTKTILMLAWPTILEQILLTFVNYVDTAMVGSLGAVATAAVSINSSTIWLVNGILSSVSIGFCVLVSKNIGAKNRDRASVVANQGIFFAISISLLIYILMQFVGPKLPELLKADKSIYKGARDYIKWISLALLFQGLFIIISGIFRAVGNTKLPFFVNVINNLMNVFLNYLLIFPSKTIKVFSLTFAVKRANLGVEGAAIATFISIALSTIFIIFILIKDKSLGLNIKVVNPFNLNWDINKKAVILALPNALERISLTVGQIFLTAIVASISTTALAAHYLAIQAESITYMPTFGFASAATTLVAQALGARKVNLAKKFAKSSIFLGTLTMSIAGIFLYIFSTQLVGFFTNDEQVVLLGSTLLRIVAVCEPFFGMTMMVFGVLRGAGDTKRPFFISIIGMWVIRLPLAYFLVNYSEYGLNGAWIAMTIDLIIRGIISFAIFKRGNFYKQIDII
ncbi:MAG: MATE family efflux transporter [Pleomorphochaeta sp.]